MNKVVGTLCLIAMGTAVACSDSTALKPTTTIPDFVYVSDSSGTDMLYIDHNGTSTLFPASAGGDETPQSAAGRIVFASLRNSAGSSDIYSAKIDGSDLQQLTNNPNLDVTPSLSPNGSTIVFASVRTGTSRIWVMNADGTSQAELATGSAENVPESDPRYSPDGTQILFNSPRTGTSQLWLVPAAGGSATQLSHEVNGAFDGSWGPTSTTVFYEAGLDPSRIHALVVATGVVSDYVTGATDVSQPECNATMCLVVSGGRTNTGDIIAYAAPDSATPLPVVHSSANERAPAFLHP